MELVEQTIERKRPETVPSKFPNQRNVATASQGILKEKMSLVLWWSLYIQLLPGISFNLIKKMNRNIRIINPKKEQPILFQRHIFFALIPWTFFSLFQIKGQNI